MSYTVSQLAKLSGVSVRTLHYYDERGLLPPSHTDSSGARRYGETELLRLQGILFYRELGFSLEHIQTVLRANAGETVAALEERKRLLTQDIESKRVLIKTIEQTIKKLRGEYTMPDSELFHGLDSEKQRNYEAQLIEQCGDHLRHEIVASRTRLKDWSQKRWAEVMAEFDEIIHGLEESKNQGAQVESQSTQRLIARHHQWICLFWEPDRVSYTGFAELIENSELRHAYSKGDPTLPGYIAEAIRHFASTRLE